MPKVDAKAEAKAEAQTSLSISSQAEIKKQTTALIAFDRGLALRELEISFSTADKNSPSGRGALIVALTRRTPNLTKLTLNFSGWLHTWQNCLGDALIEALCGLKDLESFTHRATTAARTDFGQYTLMKLVSSWPKLRYLYLAGDSNGEMDDKKLGELPPATCARESVTFERCMANYEYLAPMFAGSGESLETFEAWAMDGSLTLGGSRHPTPAFIIEHLAHAPKLERISIGGNEDHTGHIRMAFAKALTEPESFPVLRSLAYPGKEGTYKTGRGRNVI
ncbi:hypothetical protein H0H81_006151, partial [Sphagnurus paluster]